MLALFVVLLLLLLFLSDICGALERQHLPCEQVQIGDQLLQVGDMDVTSHTVADLRHHIIGEIGTTIDVTFKSASNGEVRVPKQRAVTPPQRLVREGPPSHFSAARQTTGVHRVAAARYTGVPRLGGGRDGREAAPAH